MAEQFPLILINQDIPLTLKFGSDILNNPNSITFPSKKLFQETRTIGGYVFEHWGKAPVDIVVKGLVKKQFDNNNQETVSSQELFALEQMYELDKRKMTSILGIASKINKGLLSAVTSAVGINIPNSNAQVLATTLLYYKYVIYTGFFTQFDKTESGDNPYYITYSFTFRSVRNTNDVLRDAFLKLLATPAGSVLRATFITGFLVKNAVSGTNLPL